jgi:cytochrome oxidase Cu insertion factor (SCO1/SenC/PrrC family)
MTRALPALLIAAVLAACAPGCGGSATPSTGAVTASSASGFDGAALPAATPAPGFALTDQRGHPVSLSDYRGRVVVLAFVYSRCGASCLLVAQQVRGALDELARPPAVIFLSADPGHDDAAAVAGFLARVSLDGRVEYLNGPPGPLRAALATYRVKPAGRAGHFEPPASVALIDAAGHERVLFGLEQLTPEALAHDVRTLEAG